MKLENLDFSKIFIILIFEEAYSNQHGLILVILKHVAVGLVGDRKEMGWHFRATLAHEHARHRVGVDRQPLIRIDDDAEQARVGL